MGHPFRPENHHAGLWGDMHKHRVHFAEVRGVSLDPAANRAAVRIIRHRVQQMLHFGRWLLELIRHADAEQIPVDGCHNRLMFLGMIASAN